MYKNLKCSGICPDCGIPTIHQDKRGRDESSSAWGQHIHNDYPRNFNLVDIDGVIHKRKTKVFRIIEVKKYDQSLHDSQIVIFKILSECVDTAIKSGTLHPCSGIFKLEIEEPWNMGYISRITPAGVGSRIEVEGEDLRKIETGEIWFDSVQQIDSFPAPRRKSCQINKDSDQFVL